LIRRTTRRKGVLLLICLISPNRGFFEIFNSAYKYAKEIKQTSPYEQKKEYSGEECLKDEI